MITELNEKIREQNVDFAIVERGNDQTKDLHLENLGFLQKC